MSESKPVTAPGVDTLTPEDASRRERLAKMCEQQAGLCEWWAPAWPKRDYPAEAKNWRDIATILRAASPAAPGFPFGEAMRRAREIGDAAQPEPRAEEGEQRPGWITEDTNDRDPLPHYDNCPLRNGGTDCFCYDPDRCRGCGAAASGPWSHLVRGLCIDCRDNAYHRNYTEAAMAERDGGVEELAAAECDELANLIGSIKGYEDVLHQAIAKAMRRAAALLRSRTQPVGEPVAWMAQWRYTVQKVGGEKPGRWNYDGLYRTEDEVVHLHRNRRNGDIEHRHFPLYASPQPASVDVEAALNVEINEEAASVARGGCGADYTEGFRNGMHAGVRILRRALGTQKGGE